MKIVRWLFRLILVAVVLAVLLVGTGVAFYASDGRIDANVTKRHCSMTGTNTVTVVTKMFGLEETKEFDYGKCSIVREGNFVNFYIRSQRTVIYEKEGGPCLYDSLTKLC